MPTRKKTIKAVDNVVAFPGTPDDSTPAAPDFDLVDFLTDGRGPCTLHAEGRGTYSIRDPDGDVTYTLIPGTPPAGEPTIEVENDVPHLLEALCDHDECPEWLRDELFEMLNEGQPHLFSATYWKAELEMVAGHYERLHGLR